MNEFTIEEMSSDEIDMVSGGNARDTVSGSYVSGNATACANSMLYWGGAGSGIGSISSGVIGFFGGAAFGGYLAAKYSKLCLGT